MADTNDRLVNGRIKKIFDTYQVTPNFKKREFIVTTNEQQPQLIKLEFHQDRCDLLSAYFEGDEVEVAINIRGREWFNPQGKAVYFNSFVAWRIKKTANGYIVPTNDGSGFVQHNMNLPDAKDVFDDEPGYRGQQNTTFGNPQQFNQTPSYLNLHDDDDTDLPF